MDYRSLLEHSFSMTCRHNEYPADARLAYLGDCIFDFTTYDDSMSELFTNKAIEVCKAISKRATFDYIKEAENYKWYLVMCNMPFFSPRLEWGTSIRGAWWGDCVQLESCGLWLGDDQITELNFTRETWEEFIAAIIAFSEQP